MDIKLFVANGCTLCVPLKRFAEELDNVQIINLTDEPDYIKQYNLMSIPTLVVETDDDTDVIVTPALIMERLRKEII